MKKEFKKEPVFINGKNEKLELQEITKRVIKSVTIAYYSKEEKKKKLFFLKSKKNVSKEKKEITINDSNIVFYYIPGVENATIRFSSKEEFEKVSDYDEETLFKRFIFSLVNPYQINFLLGNLKKIDWE